MSKESGSDMNGDSLEKLRTLKITSLDDEEEDGADECPVNINDSRDIYEDDEDDEEDDEEPVTLGFVEKPKNQWSLLPHLFPSKAGGFPVILQTPAFYST